MIDPHANVHAFADGELSDAEAERFRTHLGECVRCQRELHEVLQLDAAAAGSPVLQQRPVRPAIPALRFLAPVLTLAAAAAVAFVVTHRDARSTDELLAGPSGPRRLEARVSWSLGDVWRPYETLRGERALDAVPVSTLAGLEQRHETQALGGAWLLSGDTARARAILKDLSRSADVSADLAAVALAQGHAEEALELGQQALDAQPTHSRALWNKALAARELGLDALAAKTFGEVAALHESGWADEALKRQQALQARAQDELGQFQRALDAAAAMTLDHQPMALELVTAAPSVARMNLAYALRTARSKAEVEALAPVAAQLGRALGTEEALQQSLARAAAQDFKARAQLIDGFRALFTRYYQQLIALGQPIHLPTGATAFEGQAEAAFRARLLKQGSADDLVLGLPMLGLVSANAAAYEKAARTLGDPWFLFALRNEQAKAALAARDAASAERTFLEVAGQAKRTAPLRALQAINLLGGLYVDQQRVAEAQQFALEGLTLAHGQREALIEGQLLTTLSEASRDRNRRGMAQAALEERELRQPASCFPKRDSGEALAALSMLALDAERARPALQRAASCGEPLSLVGAFVLSDLLRLAPAPAEQALFHDTLAALRESETDPERVAMVEHLEGRVLIDADPVGAEKLLRGAMTKVKGDGASLARKVRAYGYGILRSEQAKEGHFEALFSLTAEELGRALPKGCALVVNVEDDRVAIAGREASGTISGTYTRIAITRPHPDGVEPLEISAVAAPIARKVFATCAPEQALRVYASFPLNGRSGWLPDDVAWTYASGLPARPLEKAASILVTDVDAPKELELPRLASWAPPASGFQVDRVLRGAQATPEAALEALGQASFMEFDAHGLVNTGSDDTALLVLSPGPSGFALTAAQVREAKLPHHPVVLLAACKAATVVPVAHERWSLPHAFLAAGASAVIAAPVDLPDAEAHEFFARLAPRVAAGENAGRALQRERAKWLAAGRPDWVRAVLVFE